MRATQLFDSRIVFQSRSSHDNIFLIRDNIAGSRIVSPPVSPWHCSAPPSTTPCCHHRHHHHHHHPPALITATLRLSYVSENTKHLKAGCTSHFCSSESLHFCCWSDLSIFVGGQIPAAGEWMKLGENWPRGESD